jgi:muramoyltetrapeptide carboxypeptidase
MELIIPQKLKKGDYIAVVSPSSGLGGLFPNRVENGVKFLKKMGFKVKEYNTTRKSLSWSSGTAEERAKDLMGAFMDDEVKGIICSVGGYSANQLLPLLDYKEIRMHPKVFCGYSDISVLHYALYSKAGLQTFYGPSVMVQFAEFPEPLSYTLDYFKKATMENGPIGKITASTKWTDEVLDWGKKENDYVTRKLKPNKGFEWLRTGKSEGPIIGGCLPSIMHLCGTEYWPDYNGKILLLEIPDGHEFGKGEALYDVESFLYDMKNSRVFNDITGLVFGRPFNYTEEELANLKKIILKSTENTNFPILFGVDVGHSDPQITIPLGALTKLDSKNNLFEIDN